MNVSYSEQLERVRRTSPELAEQITPLRNLEAILGWMSPEAMRLLDLIQQDEYCYDLLVPEGDADRWIVFGLT